MDIWIFHQKLIQQICTANQVFKTYLCIYLQVQIGVQSPYCLSRRKREKIAHYRCKVVDFLNTSTRMKSCQWDIVYFEHPQMMNQLHSTSTVHWCLVVWCLDFKGKFEFPVSCHFVYTHVCQKCIQYYV